MAVGQLSLVVQGCGTALPGDLWLWGSSPGSLGLWDSSPWWSRAVAQLSQVICGCGAALPVVWGCGTALPGGPGLWDAVPVGLGLSRPTNVYDTLLSLRTVILVCNLTVTENEG